MKRFFNPFAFLAGILLAFSSCTNNNTSEEEATAPEPEQEYALTEAALDSAKALFSLNCSGCHGETPATFADREWKHGNTREEIIKSITFGHPDAGMPAFEHAFTQSEIANLASYIQLGINKVEEYSFEEQANLPDTFRTEKLSFTLDTIASGFEKPWGVAFLPEGDLLFTEISGKLYRVDPDKKMQEIEGVPEVRAEGQGGLLDIELHPDFANNKLLYLSYSAVKEEGGKTLTTTAITRAKLEGNKLSSQKRIFEALPWSEMRHHYGSRMEFGQDGFLYFSVGDRGNRDENPQDLSRHPGKIHRIKDDGSIPADNPFVNQKDAMPSVYSYGHRNPQGLALHPQTGVLWEHEHGPRGGDEVNIIQKGGNYGWPVISYGINYDGTTFTELTEKQGMEQPVWYWVPSIAPAGMTFVSGNRYPGWEGNLLSGSLRFKYLNRNIMNGNTISGEEKILQNIGRLRDVKMSPDGYIYVAVEEPGAIYKLVPVQ